MRQKDEMERTENARARSNRHILWLTYGERSYVRQQYMKK